MSEKPEALEVAADLRARIARHPSSDTTRTLLICDDAARCLEEQHAENERLNAVALQAQNAAIDLAKQNERLREAMRSAMAMLDKRDPEPAGAFAVLLLALNPELQSAKNALRREEVKP